MRILHVIPGIAPRYGGPSQAIIGMCRTLHERMGINILIATTDADGPGRMAVPLERATQYGGVATIFFSRQWSESFKYSRPLSQWLNANVCRFNAVHIHAVFSHACLAAARAARRAAIPYIVRPLGTLDPWSLRQKALRKQVFWHLGGKQMLTGAAAVHYTTADEQQLAEARLGIRRGVVVPLGVDDEYFAEPLASGLAPGQQTPQAAPTPYVLSMSRLHPKKALDRLIDAFASATIDNTLETWQLVIAGDGDPAYIRSLKQLAAASRCQERIHFPGWLHGRAKLTLLRNAAMFAAPSYQENFGIAAAEAMACGVPVLVSPYVNLARDIRAAGAGWITDVEGSALAHALAGALNDSVERARRGSAARNLARSRFSWDRVGEQLAQVYADVAVGGELVDW